MKIDALSTHTDWFYTAGTWGKPGHQRIASLAQAAGIRRFYWRTHNGGQAMYPSKICTIQDGAIFRDPNFQGYGSLPRSHFEHGKFIDYREWDQVGDMYEEGSKAGLEVCHWYTLFEDNHGVHVGSEFEKENPRFRCTLRTGEAVSGCLDFWFPEVREYKLAVVDELLEKPTNRLLLDFLRRNGKPSADADGNYRYGYNPEIRDGFLQETGRDITKLQPGDEGWEAWIDYNARPLSEFIREVHRRASAKGIPLDVLVWALDTRHWKALDLPALLEEGVIDKVLTGTLRYAFSEADAKRQLTGMREFLGPDAPVAPGLFAYHTIAPVSVDAFVGAAEEADCQNVILHEVNCLLESPIGDRLRAWKYGKPHVKREVRAATAEAEATKYSDFSPCFDTTGKKPDQNTSLQAFYDQETLTIRVICEERSPDQLLPVPGIGKENYNGNALKARAFWNPYESVHLFLDAEHRHEDYYHFILSPDGEKLSERRLHEDWDGKWTGESAITERAWTATFTIPWKSLKIDTLDSLVMGLQVVRMQNNPKEISAYFVANGRRTNPLDFGHLRLA